MRIGACTFLMSICCKCTPPPRYAPVPYASFGIGGSGLKDGNPEVIPLFLPLIILS